MTAAAPQRRSRGYRRRCHADDDRGINPLLLFADWLRHAPGFARPALLRPLPRIRFTCRECHAEVLPTASG